MQLIPGACFIKLVFNKHLPQMKNLLTAIQLRRISVAYTQLLYFAIGNNFYETGPRFNG